VKMKFPCVSNMRRAQEHAGGQYVAGSKASTRSASRARPFGRRSMSTIST
jgi:hypothetical protein